VDLKEMSDKENQQTVESIINGSENNN